MARMYAKKTNRPGRNLVKVAKKISKIFLLILFKSGCNDLDKNFRVDRPLIKKIHLAACQENYGPFSPRNLTLVLNKCKVVAMQDATIVVVQ